MAETAPVTKRDKRISVRLTREQRDCITRAASLETGGDVSRFVADAAIRAAKTTIYEHGVTQLTDEVRTRFYELLLNPPAPSADLIALALQHVPEGFELER